MTKVTSRKFLLFHLFFAAILLVATVLSAADKVVVVPLGGASGNAAPSDVVKGKTFSSLAAGKGAVGTLELPQAAQGFTNSLGMKFKLLPAGSFVMGSPDTEPAGPYPNEQPQHQVTLSKPFYMQTTEVTNKQWDTLVIDYTAIGVNPSDYTGDDLPVNDVTWYEAAFFANLLSYWEGKSGCYQLTGCTGALGTTYTCTAASVDSGCNGYRLPTEAEWEYAARATTTTAWAYAESYDESLDPGQVIGFGFNSNLDAIGWYEFNKVTQYATGPKPVSRKQANQWGLYDISGNVGEWCQDFYSSLYYSDPDNGIDPQGPATGSTRVTRGGRWDSNSGYARSAYRSALPPGDHNYYYTGFRLVLPAGQ